MKSSTMYVKVINKAAGYERIHPVEFVEWNKQNHWIRTSSDTGFHLKEGDNAYVVNGEGRTISHLFVV